MYLWYLMGGEGWADLCENALLVGECVKKDPFYNRTGKEGELANI